MYLSDDFIMGKLNSLDEHKMAKDIFVPLLKKKGLKGVKFTGGTSEEGIDVEYYEESNADNSRQYAGIQFKKGDITYSSKGINGTVKEIKNQAEEAFAKDICDVNSGGVDHISRFIVATTGEINENARKMINKAKNRGEQTNISYWDKDKLSDDIRTYMQDEFMEYFNISEDEEDDIEYNDEYIVTEDYIIENYGNLVMQCKRCINTMSLRQNEIIKAIINHFFEEDSFYISIGDLLYYLERTEDDVRDDLIDLQRLNYIEYEEDTIYLSGRASAFKELIDNIINEMINADEAEENGSNVMQIFNNIID